MHLDYTPDQKALRDELRAYFSELMTPERRAGIKNLEGGQIFKETVRQMGKDGWLGVGWPKEFGGGGRTAIEQLIFFDEPRRAGAPLPFVTLNTVGPCLMNARLRGAQARVPAPHPRRRGPLRDRLHRARRRHGSGFAQDLRREGRRRVGHQRNQDLHQWRRTTPNYIWTRRPHRPRCQEAQGHLDLHRRYEASRLQRCARSTPSAAATPA